ncbi:hypothetical protein HNP37_004459 [Flavobacterium nitrogenifigens]|uniref:Uncharacterized protein n=2 Tax=Flavobacterium TaxID=237 RepID=A0A7W7J242_9FLAO|nr:MULTISPECIES: hypothetical protein [Flavobacterium]MBB4804372.1 hypothetical protein [Flavobacterium nitrogenifigens]MBB6389232.1 hypothetical protein [Flavobacterium notoginsengisoli]
MDGLNKEEKAVLTEIMSIKEVGVKIGRKDKECVVKWLNANNVTIHRMPKLIFVYKIDFECAMILPQVKDFKRTFPTQWERYYQKTIKNEALFSLIMLKLEVETAFQPTTKVKRSKKDEELYQKLMS